MSHTDKLLRNSDLVRLVESALDQRSVLFEIESALANAHGIELALFLVAFAIAPGQVSQNNISSRSTFVMKTIFAFFFESAGI